MAAGDSGENKATQVIRAIGEKTPIHLSMLVSIVVCTVYLSTGISDVKNGIVNLGDKQTIYKATQDEEIKTIKETIIRLEDRLRTLELKK